MFTLFSNILDGLANPPMLYRMSSVAAVLGINRHRLDALMRQRGHCRLCCTPFDLDEVEYSGRALAGRVSPSVGLDCQFCHVLRPISAGEFFDVSQIVQAHRGEVFEVPGELREAGFRTIAARVEDFLADPRAYDYVLKAVKAPVVPPHEVDQAAERLTITPGTVAVEHMPMVLACETVRLMPLNPAARSVWGVLHDDARAISNKYNDYVCIEPGIEITSALYRGFYGHATGTFTFLPQSEWRKIRKWPRPDVQAVIDHPHHIHWTILRFDGETVALLSYLREDNDHQARRVAMTWVYASSPEAPDLLLDAVVQNESLPFGLRLLAREAALSPEDDEPTLNQMEEESA